MAKKEALKYRIPDEWFRYDAESLMQPVSRAGGSVHAFVTAPFQLGWLEGTAHSRELQEITASCALAGHFVVSAAEERALLAGGPDLTAAEAVVGATAKTYDWISKAPPETPVTEGLLLETHRLLVAAEPPESEGLRTKDAQAYFGDPGQRGAKGGRECREALAALVRAISTDTSHAPLIRGLAAHYHLWTMHPFNQANGRTARALDCFFRQAAGLRGPHFVAMSAFYLSEQEAYREALGEARRAGHDLTPFLEFALPGVTLECERALSTLRRQTSIVLFRDTMGTLFGQIRTGKKRPMVTRHVGILDLLLEEGEQPARQIYYRMAGVYASLRNPWKAFLRDISDLLEIGAVEEGASSLSPRLAWPSEITAARFMEHYSQAARFSMSAKHPA